MTALFGGVLAFVLGVAGGVPRQRPADLVKWTAAAPAAGVKSGGTFTVELTASIASGWHVYAITQPATGPVPMTLTAHVPAGFQLLTKQIAGPPPVVTRDPTFQADTHYYETRVTLSVPFSVRSTVRAGTHALPIDITYQACSSQICLRPFTEKLAIDVTVTPAAKGRQP
jgi:DsbC/DsbD-like thiol-disulfide interchange protein